MTKNQALLDLEINRNVLADDETLAIVAQALRTCLRDGDKKTLRAFLDSQEPADIATILDTLEAAEALAAMRHVDLYEQAQIFRLSGSRIPDRALRSHGPTRIGTADERDEP